VKPIEVVGYFIVSVGQVSPGFVKLPDVERLICVCTNVYRIKIAVVFLIGMLNEPRDPPYPDGEGPRHYGVFFPAVLA